MTQLQRRRIWWFFLAVVALVALVLLAAGLPQFQLEMGDPFSFERAEEESSVPVEGETETESPLFEQILRIGVILYGWFLILFVIGIVIYLILSPDRWKELLRILLRVAVFSLLVYILLRRGIIAQLLQNLQMQPGAGEDPTSPVAVPPDMLSNPPTWLVLVISIVVSLLLVAGIWAVLWFTWLRHRRPERSPLDDVAREAQQALADLRAGADIQDTVRRCYYEMSRVLSQRRGIERPQAMTPREFEQRLARVGLPTDPIRRLTRLFERVRYGTIETGTTEAEEAMACLSAVVAAVEEVS